METLLAVIGSQAFQNFALLLIPVVIALIKRSEWYTKTLDAETQEKVDCIWAGVAEAYDTYVRITKSSNGGKLTDTQIKNARRISFDAANKIAERRGIKLDLPRETVQVETEKAVATFK